MYPTVKFFYLEIPTYTLLFLIAFIMAVIIAGKTGADYKIKKADVLYASVYSLIGMYTGAKLMYFATKLPTIITRLDVFVELIKTDLPFALNYSFGGLVFYGGLFGTVLGIYIYCRQYHLPFGPFLDSMAPIIPFVHGVGRISCFCAGCCYGIEYHGFGSVKFNYNEFIPELDDVPRVPVQLIEAALNFILCLCLFVLVKKSKTKKIRLKTGQLMGIYILSYAGIRMCTECLRGDIIRGKIGIFSTSQIISIMLIPAGVYLLKGKFKDKMQRGKTEYND